MKIVLFASGNVGLETTKFLQERNALSYLVLDPADINKKNDAILAACTLPDNKIFYCTKEYTADLKPLKEAGFDLIILALWPYIIKQSLLDLPTIGTLNFHPSYLPYNGGKHTSFWTLVEGTPYGVTIHWVDEGIDTGNLAFQERIEPTWLDTGYTLQVKTEKLMVDLFKQNFETIINNKIPSLDQSPASGTFHYKSEFKEATELNLKQWVTGRTVLNLLRAATHPDFEGAWFIKNGKKYYSKVKITKLTCSKNNPYEIVLEKTYQPGQLLSLIQEAQKSDYKGAWFKDGKDYFFVTVMTASSEQPLETIMPVEQNLEQPQV